MAAGTSRRRIDAPAAYYLFEGGCALLNGLAFTLMLVLQVQVAGLSPLELVLMGTVLEITLLVCEVPTGVVADLYSRRRSVLLGAAIIGVSMLLQGGWPSFWPTLVAQVIWGIGYTFVSGAIQAWITDEVGEAVVQPVFTRGTQVALVCGLVGTVLAGALGLLDLRLPMLAAGAGYLLLALTLVVVMPETGFRPLPAELRETWGHVRQVLSSGLALTRRPGVVRSFLGVSLLLGLSSEAVDRLWTAFVLEQFTLPSVFGLSGPALWFSAFALVGTLVSLLASVVANRVAGRRLNAEHPGALLAGLVGLQVVGIAGFALAGWLWLALIALWLRDAARVIAEPVQAAWVNRSIDSRSRATTLSLVSQADALGQVIGGPPLGALAGRASIRVGLLASAAVLAPAVVLLARVTRHGEGRPSEG